jgi:CrcB protein
VISAFGAFGSLSRYLIYLIFPASGSFLATALVNIAGSLLAGVAYEIIRSYGFSDIFRLAIITGFLGGFTTFSAFSLDVIKMLENQNYYQAISYTLITLVFAVIAALLGVYLCRKLLHP